jgi:hypothetical protein
MEPLCYVLGALVLILVIVVAALISERLPLLEILAIIKEVNLSSLSPASFWRGPL